MGKQLVSISCLLAATASLASLPAMAATFVVDKNFWGHTNTVGTFSWAIHQANETPGLDTIQLYSDVSLDDFLPTPESESYHFVADIRDPAGLVINGRGHSLTADPSFITPSGVVHTKTNPAPFKAGDFITGDSKSFARVHDSISNLFIDNLTVDGLNRFLRIGQNSSVTIKDSAFKNIGAFGHPGAPLLSALDDSMLNLQGVYMHNVNRYDDPLDGGEFTWFPVIEGTNANINIEKSMLDLYFSTTAGVLSQMGGTANVVSSVIMGKGLSIIDSAREGVLNVVNSLFRPYDHSATARIQAYRGGEANISASTIQFNGGRTTDVPSPSAPFPCPADYRCNGAPLQAFDGGMIHLNTSSVSVLNMGFARIEAGVPCSGVIPPAPPPRRSRGGPRISGGWPSGWHCKGWAGPFPWFENHLNQTNHAQDPLCRT